MALTIVRFDLGPLDNKTYLLADEAAGEAAIVDPTFDSRPIWEELQERRWRLTWVLNTHAHIDHVIENAFFVEKSGAPLALHPEDAFFLQSLEEQALWMGIEPPAPSTPTHALEDEQALRIGNETVQVVHTPGHSPGSVSFLAEGIAIVGDVLFNGSIGRTDLPAGSMTQLLTSIHGRLLTLPDSTHVYPGHGPETSIGHERRTNPFLNVP